MRGLKITSISIDERLHTAAKARVREVGRERRGYSLSAYIEELLRADLDGEVAGEAGDGVAIFVPEKRNRKERS